MQGLRQREEEVGESPGESSQSGGGQARGVLLTGHPKEPGIKAAKAGGLWLSMA